MMNLILSAAILLICFTNAAKATSCDTADYDQMDVQFLLNGYYDEEKDSTFGDEKSLVNGIIEKLTIGSDKTRVGLMQYGCCEEAIGIELNGSKSDLIDEISGYTSDEQENKVADGTIKLAIKKFQEASKTNPRVLVILATSDLEGNVNEAANEARTKDVKLIAIGTKKANNEAQLNAIVNDASRVHISNDLSTDREDLVAKVSQSIKQAANSKCVAEIEGKANITLSADNIDKTVAKNTEVKFTCELKPNHDSTIYKWLKDGTEIATAFGTVTTEKGISNLVVKMGSRTQGNYSCEAEHPIGISNNSKELTLELSCDGMNYNLLDLMIVLDGSGSVKPHNFLKMKDFVNEVINQTRIANDATNIGIVQYSDRVETEFDLRAYDSKDSLLTAVTSIDYQRGRKTYTGAGIKRATETFDDKRPDAARAMVVITDGHSNDEISAEAEKARRNGIEMIAVGVSAGIQMKQLYPIVNDDKSRAFKLENFEDFSGFVHNLTERIRRTTNEKCYKQIEDAAKTELSADKPTTDALVDNDVIKFTCTMTPTDDETRYIWFKDGIEIPSSDAITMENGSSYLTIKIEQLDQAGAYSCKGVHPFGIPKEGDKTIAITILLRPKIKDPESENITLEEGNSTSLPCEVVGDPAASIKWYFNDVEISNSTDNLELDSTTGALKIKQAQTSTIGEYKCVAENTAGNDTRTVKVHVETCDNANYDKLDLYFVLDGSGSVNEMGRKPGNFKMVLEFVQNVVKKLKIGPTDALVGVLQYSFVPMVNGYQNLNRPSWKNKIETHLGEIENQADLLLKISSIKYVAGGTLTGKAITEATEKLVAKNRPGTPKAMIIITDGDSEDKVGPPSDDARAQQIEVIAMGVGNYNKSQLQEIANNDSSKIFYIKYFDDMEGFVSNLTGSIRRSSNAKCAKKIKAVAKVKISANREMEGLKVGHIITLTCKMTPANPDIEYTWFKDNIEQQPNTIGEIKSGNGTSEWIFTVDSGLVGVYSCRGAHPIGVTEMSENKQLTIVEPPIISNSKDEAVSIEEEESKTLPCDATGTPEPSVKWYFNGTEITDSSDPKYNIQNGALVINKAESSLNGDYKCIAENAGGNDTRIVHLNVQTAPKILDAKLDNLSIEVNAPVTLPCNASGIPLPSITWYFNGSKLDNSSKIENGQLVIEKFVPSFAGEYKCVAENVVGTDNRTVNLSAKSKVEPENECKGSCDTMGMELVKKVTTFVEQVNKLLLNMVAMFKDCFLPKNV